MKHCYLCGLEFDQNTVLKHDEHIIQQAIGGTLTHKSILCSSCGTSLGNEIDVPFNKTFQNIATLLDIKKDRKTNKKSSIEGKIVNADKDFYGVDLNGTDVIWKDFKVTPVKPMHKYIEESNKVIIYASQKQAKQYIKKIEKEYAGANPDITICDDIPCMVSYPFEINNREFKRGLAKIAIGFASSLGISRTDLPLVLSFTSETKTATIKENIPMVQFYPLCVLDKEIEKNKSDIRYYPTHTLILFTAVSDPTQLICYIELFSTFQFYVILNDSYVGKPIYEYHYQRLEREQDYVFEPGRRHYKEREMILHNLGITQEKIDKSYNAQKHDKDAKSAEEIEYELIQEALIKQKYSVDFETEISAAVDLASTKLMGEAIQSKNLNFVTAVKRNVDLYYHQCEEDDIFNISSYRRCYYRDNKHHDYIISLLDLAHQSPKKLQTYNRLKFEQLSRFTQAKSIKEKFS